MLLSADEIARFRECLRNRQPLVFADEFDVADLLGETAAFAEDARTDGEASNPLVGRAGAYRPTRDHRPRISEDDPRLLEAMSRFVSAFSDCPDISFRAEDNRSDLTITPPTRNSRLPS
jgi:hypothetical protein